MKQAAYRVALTGASLLAICGVAGCSGGTDDAVVRVAGHAITQATIARSMFAIASSASRAPGQPLFQPPVPPRYTACIKYLHQYGSKEVIEGTVPASSGLKGECEHDYKKLKLKALYFFISYQWVAGEAAELGVKLDERHVAQQLTALRRFYTGTYTKEPELTMSAKLGLYASKIQQLLEARASKRGLTLQQRQQALDAFGASFQKRWTAVTDCEAGSIVPLCKQYRPPGELAGLVPPSVPLTDMTAE
jgi:hypothetical protein